VTSIAIKDGEAAADTQLTSETCAFRVQKLIRLPDGGVATGAGAWSRAYAYIQWIIDGESGDPPDLRGAEVWVVRPDKSIWVGECGPLYPISTAWWPLAPGATLPEPRWRTARRP